MKTLKTYICEKFKGFGDKVMNIKDICQTLLNRGITKFNGEDNPDFIDLYKSLSFYDEMNDKHPFNIKLDHQAQYIYFINKSGGQEYVYFSQMHKGEHGNSDDLMKIVKYLRKKVKDSDAEFEKYGNHPKMNKVEDVIISIVEKEIAEFNRKHKTNYQFEIRDYNYQASFRTELHKNGLGRVIELFKEVVEHDVIHSNKTVGVMCFWEDSLGCLHFSFSRGHVLDGSDEEMIEWNINDVKNKVELFVHKSIQNDK